VRGGFGDALGRARRERFQGGDEAFVDHARADVGPARRLVLLGDDRAAVFELAADHFLERVEVEVGLGGEAGVEERADLEEFVDRLIDLGLGAALAERVDDQGVELGVLRFLIQ